MKHNAPIAALLFFAISAAGANAETLQANPQFEGAVPLALPEAAPQTGHVSIQTWKLSGPKDVVHEIPLQGFYIAHLLSGAIATTIDGQTVKQPASAYWTVKAGASMKVSVLGELAVIETIVVTK